MYYRLFIADRPHDETHLARARAALAGHPRPNSGSRPATDTDPQHPRSRTDGR
jgi:hypothetical protein